MNYFFIFLAFVPYVSIPPFVYSSSYVQPFSLVVSWLYLIYKYKFKSPLLSLEYSLLFLSFVVFCFFIPLSPFSLGFSQGYSILFGYTVGIIQYILLTSLFKHSLSTSSGTLFNSLIFSLLFIPLIVFIAISIDYIFPGFFDVFKSRSDSVADGLDFSLMYRGRSGLLPEPSYSGLILSASFLSSFYLFSAKKALAEYSLFKSFKTFYLASLRSFFSFRIVYFSLISSLFAVLLGLSMSSVICFILLTALLILPLISPSFILLLLFRNLIRVICICLLAFSLIFLLSRVMPPDSRIFSIFRYINIFDFQTSISKLILIDQSGADRFNSIFLGFYPLSKFPPFGLGLGSFHNFFTECSDPVIEAFGLMCGSVFNSTRNHNAFSNFSQDFGVFGFIFIVFLPMTFVPFRLFSIPKSLLLLFPVIVFLFMILPSPLGSPTSWSVYASATVLLQCVDRVSRSNAG